MAKHVLCDWEPFLTQRPLSDSPEIFKGANVEICSLGDFESQMSAAGICNGLSTEDFVPFRYLLDSGSKAIKVLGFATNFDESMLRMTRVVTIEDRVETLLMSLKSKHQCPVLFQFWAPIKGRSGQAKLTLSEQPFGLGELYRGLCRYICIHRTNEEQYGQNGPPARVFKRGLPEVCHDINHYSPEEFPTRDDAIDCGIISYFALPLFESGATQHCVGVLECFSLECSSLYEHELIVECVAKGSKIDHVFLSPHFHKCDKIRGFPLLQADFIKVLEVVVEAHQLPLIQVWVPCTCDDLDQALFSVKWFCFMRIYSQNLQCSSQFKYFNEHGTFLRSGEGLVGRAYSEKSPCFFRYTGQLSLSDNPSALLARFAGLAACFVIPLGLVHPLLDAMFLEIFLPPERTCTNGNSEAVLKSLLFTVAQEFSKLKAAVGLKQDEEFQVTLIHSDSKKFDYFHINRRVGVNVEMSASALHNDPNAQEVTTAMVEDRLNELEQDTNAQDIADSSREVIAKIAEDHISLDVPKQHPNQKDTTDDTSREVIATMAEDHISLGVPNQHPNEKGTTEGEAISTMTEDQITFEVLKPYFGNIIDAATKDLGVSRSTLKRKCRELGIKRWPWHKRNKVRHVQSNPRLQEMQTRKHSADKEAPQSQSSDSAAERVAAAPSANCNIICNSYDMIGKATYDGDIVMVPLSSSTGIEELRCGLKQRFELQVERFKIKYKFDEDWILITCDRDLHLGMEMIKSTGKSTMNLSIFPQPRS